MFHDCFTTVIADRLIHIGSAVGRFRILIFFLTTSELNHLSIRGTTQWIQEEELLACRAVCVLKVKE